MLALLGTSFTFLMTALGAATVFFFARKVCERAQGALLGFAAGDAIASLAICVIILKVAYDVMKDALNNMTDTPCDREFERKIGNCIEEVPGVVRIDALRTRKFGNRVYVDAEIAVDGALPLRDAHVIAEAVHHELERDYPDVKHCTVHVNPA